MRRSRLSLRNYDAASPRHVSIAGGVFNWRGECVAPISPADAQIDLKPAEARDIVLKQQLPPCAYELMQMSYVNAFQLRHRKPAARLMRRSR